MPSRRPLKDLCLFAGATAQKEDTRDSLHLLLIFPKLAGPISNLPQLLHISYLYIRT